jgi:hypothetical protein
MIDRSWFKALAAVLVVAFCSATNAWAQNNGGGNNGGGNNIAGGFFSNRAVGGVAIDAHGVLLLPGIADFKGLREAILADSAKPSGDLAASVEMRKISLRALEAALQEARASGKDKLSDELFFLAGMQRIQYVIVLPEENDIVLAGPGEGWKVLDNGYVVGVTTGLPVLRLDDLLVALRTVENARRGGLTCSIDPTEQGLRQFAEVEKASGGRMTPGIVSALAEAMGPQKITVTGVPDTSRMARVLVAADYRMKRYAMELDKAPVPGLPSYLGMLKAKKAVSNNALPRWWMACNYEPLLKSADGLAWELRGPGVKVMSEEEVVEGGKRKASGKSGGISQQWADAMTAKYGEMSVKDPVFGELRNVMDLCVVSALIAREDMLHRVKLELPNILSEKDGAPIQAFNAPKEVATQCSLTKSGNKFIINASGGVEINSWSVVEKFEESADMGKLREKAAGNQGKALWWN